MFGEPSQITSPVISQPIGMAEISLAIFDINNQYVVIENVN